MTGFIGAAIAVLAVLLWIVTIYDLIRRHLGAGPTAGWLVVIILLPFVGAIAYWALRKAPDDEVQRRMDTEAEIRRGGAPPTIGL